MRAGTDTALARVVTVFGAAHPHHAYLFANRRSNRMKVLVHDGIGVWLAARRLNSGRFVWPKDVSGTLTLSRPQFDALALERPWAVDHVRENGDADAVGNHAAHRLHRRCAEYRAGPQARFLPVAMRGLACRQDSIHRGY